MKPLLPQCNIAYKFGRINVDKEYFHCCRIPPIGNFEEDGTYKEFWNSKKLNDLRKRLRYNLKEQAEEWNNLCYECPHYVENKMLYESGEIVDDLPKTGPETFDIEVGNPCNHRCNFCWFWSYDMLDNNAQRKDFKGWAKKQLDLETYISIVDDLKELGGCEWISMCGCGEPFIVKDIMKMIEYTKNLGFNLKIFTNFSRVNLKDIDNLIKWGVDRLEVNISAGTEETYCKTRKLKSKDWNLLIDNLTYLNEKRKELNLLSPIKYVVIVTKENIEEIDEIFELAIKLGCCFIDFRDLTTEGVYKGEGLLPTEKQIEVFNEKFLKNIKKYNLKEIKDEYYFYSEKLNLGVFNECISYRG